MIDWEQHIRQFDVAWVAGVIDISHAEYVEKRERMVESAIQQRMKQRVKDAMNAKWIVQE